MTNKEGDRVKVHYEGSFEEGPVFDSTFVSGAPIEFELGASNILPGFSDAVKDMEVGAERTIRLEPSMAYGEVDPGRIFDMDLANLPVEGSPVVGREVQIQLKEGLAVTGRITAVKGERITLDLNHPLSGKVLIYRIELIEVIERGPQEEEGEDPPPDLH